LEPGENPDENEDLNKEIEMLLSEKDKNDAAYKSIGDDVYMLRSR
jgi:hypothetical protein